MLPTIQQALKKIIRTQPDSASWAAKVFQSASKQKRLTDSKMRELIRKESEIGAQLFGEIPPGHHREFFCMDSRTWVWHEEWSETLSGEKKYQTVRYEVRDSGVLKSVNGQDYAWVGEDEARNLAHAAVLYHQYVSEKIYKRSKDQQGQTDEMPHMKLDGAQSHA